MSLTLVVLQPGYLPWLGFFDQMRRCDVFVYYDDVQFDKHGWRNRNRIKSPEGPKWLTVPVLHAGLNWPEIRDVRIDTKAPWARKHLGSLQQYYSKAPYYSQYYPTLETLLKEPWDRLIDLDLAVAAQMCAWLQTPRETLRSSELNIDGDKSERLLRICQHVGADRYLSGNAAQSYLDVSLFERHGITVEWQNYTPPSYPQLYGDFVPYLSAIDLLMNCGEDSAAILAGEHPA